MTVLTEQKSGMTRTRNAMAYGLRLLLPPRKTSPDAVRTALEAKKIKKVLILRPQQGIGDLLLGTPVLRALKETYPWLEIHFLATPHNAVAVQNNPHLTRVWIWNKRKFWNPLLLFGFWRALYRERFCMAIELVGNTPSFTSFIIARVLRVGCLWSYDTANFYGGTNWSRYLADVVVPVPPADATESRKFSALVEAIAPQKDPAPQFFPTAEDEARIQEIWPSLAAPGKKTIGIFLGGNAVHSHRLWTASAWAELTQQLLAAGLHVVAILPPKNLRASSGAPEANFYEGFRKALGHAVPVFDEKGFGKAAALIRRFDFFVCPDGGLFHVSCAVGARTLGLFFGTDPARWRPPVPWAFTLAAPANDPKPLSPLEVARFIQQKLSNNGLREPSPT